MFDGRFARTWTLLALILVVSPLAGVLSSTLTRSEARSGAPTSSVPPASPRAESPQANPPPVTDAPVARPPEPMEAARASEDGTASAGDPAPSATPPPASSPEFAASGPTASDVATVAALSSAPEATLTATPTQARGSVFDHGQVVALYGSPISPDLGVLGLFPPDEAAVRVREEASIYDRLNGDRSVTPALDLIYAQAQADQTENGLYLRYLDDWSVAAYLSVAERYDLQLILDLQIGRGNVVDEVRKVERFLLNPRVHVAIDPEYAVGPDGVPLWTPGRITGHDINDVQDYLHDLIEAHGLPPKMLVIHQYMEDTVVSGEAAREVPDVDVVLNMDGIGEPHEKRDKYHEFASRPYAMHRSYNVFILQDNPVSSEEEIMQLSPQPDMVMYQ